MKKFSILFLLYLISIFTYTHATGFFDKIESSCTTEEIVASGLYKLTPEEREALEIQMLEKGAVYPAMISKVENANDLKWVYEAKPFETPDAFSNIPYSESKMIYDLAICAIFQNEAPWLEEWIEYHKLVGVKHFYLYNNCSNDHYLEVLEPYIKNGEVELIQYPVTTFPVQTQNVAYQDGLLKARGKARWLAIIDTDEFIVPMKPYNNLLDLLAKYEKYGGLGVNWQMFGTSGVPSIPEGKLMIEMLTQKAPRFHDENRFIKSIVKPHRVKSIGDPHYCHYLKNFNAVDSSTQPIPLSLNFSILTDRVCINHYWYRTEDYYHQVKVPRRIKYEGAPRDPEFVKQHIDTLNREECQAILRFVPALKKQMNKVK